MSAHNLPRCACGSTIRLTGAEHCVYCRRAYNRTAKRESTALRARALRHVPSSPYTQHDAIAARFRWAQAVQR